MCGCHIKLEIKAQSGREYSYYSHPTTKRSVKLQAGSAQLEAKTTSTRSRVNHTPTKTRPIPGDNAGPSDSASHPKPIHGLPGKKSKLIKSQAKTKPAQNKCKICKVIYESRKDKTFKEKKGAAAAWLGCDVPDCSYWAHACCLGIKVTGKQAAKNIPFKCRDHN